MNDLEKLSSVELRRLAKQAQENGDESREILILQFLTEQRKMNVEAVIAERRLRELGLWEGGQDAPDERLADQVETERPSGGAAAPAQPPSGPPLQRRTATPRQRVEFYEPVDNYRNSVAIAKVIKVMGWIAVAVGVLVFFVVVGSSTGAQGRYGGGPNIFGGFIGGLVFGAPSVFFGLLLVLAAEAAEALFDTANTNAKVLAIARHRLKHDDT